MQDKEKRVCRRQFITGRTYCERHKKGKYVTQTLKECSHLITFELTPGIDRSREARKSIMNIRT